MAGSPGHSRALDVPPSGHDSPSALPVVVAVPGPALVGTGFCRRRRGGDNGDRKYERQCDPAQHGHSPCEAGSGFTDWIAPARDLFPPALSRATDAAPRSSLRCDRGAAESCAAFDAAGGMTGIPVTTTFA